MTASAALHHPSEPLTDDRDVITVDDERRIRTGRFS
jgi:hypothetical protein